LAILLVVMSVGFCIIRRYVIFVFIFLVFALML
jgi:hypothetical protein